jgi:probable phosphomutase (TIGR03848 family)
MATVLLLRHGRTTTNAGGTLAGHQPIEVDEVGRAQSEAVGRRLAAATLPLAAVVTSPLPRCRQSVALALPGVEPALDERLIECGYGDWTGQPLKKLAKHPLWRVVQAHPSAARFPGEGGEAMADMSRRAVAAIREWDDRVSATYGPDATWLACSHGDVIKAIVADALGMHLDLFQRLAIAPGSITTIAYGASGPTVLGMNTLGEATAS